MPVKSFITRPVDNAKLNGSTTIRGFAWAGENRVARVEVSLDGGATWRNSELSGEDREFAWRLWQLPWRAAEPGYCTILSRATDTAGRTQPLVATWNPSGYLYNAVDRVGVTVVAA